MDQAILREYLIALGFRIDQTGEKKVDRLLTRMDKKGLALGGTLVALGVTAAKLSHNFARSMERMWYSTRYMESTVANVQALEFGARGVGLEAGRASGALKNMTAAIRSNPGLIGLLNGLGIPVKGRDKADVMLDLVKALRSMPFYVAERYAALFGIPAEDLFNMQEGLEKMKQGRELRREMAKEMGYDADKAAEAAKEYMNLWRETSERATIFGQILATAILPWTRELAGVTNEVMKDWTRIVQESTKYAKGDSFTRRFIEGATGIAEGDRVTLTPEARQRIGEQRQPQAPATPGSLGERWNKLMRRVRPKVHGHHSATDPDAVDAVTADVGPARPSSNVLVADPRAGDTSPGGVDEPPGGRDPKQLFAELERKYALPRGLLDAVWAKESARGKFMLSPKKAKGHFGFMDPTAKAYGLKDPNNLEESADASARMWADLLKQYKGDTRKAAAAYNWGSGNVARHGLGKAPAETRDYMDTIAGAVSIQANPEIHIHGVSDPEKAADSVVRQQRTVNSDIVRNMSPKVR